MMKSLINLLIIVTIPLSLINTSTNLTQAEDQSLLHVTDVAWNNESSQVAAVGIYTPQSNGYINVLDIITGQTSYSFNSGSGGFASVAWSPDDRFIAVGGYNQTIMIIDVKEGTHVTTLAGHRATVTTLDWNSTGTQLVSGGIWDQQVILWDMVTYNQIYSLSTGDPWSVEFSPDDQRIAVGGMAGLFLFPAPINEDIEAHQNEYRVAQAYIGSLAWNEDGTRIAYSTQTFDTRSASVNVVDSTNGDLLTTFVTNDEAIFGIDWSVDDSLLAAQSLEGTVRIWDIKSNILVENYTDIVLGTVRYPEQINFSSYGGRLAFGSTIPVNSIESATDDVIQPTDQGQSLANGAVQIVVPAPSPERLQSIADLCGAAPTVEQALNADIAAADYEGVIAQMEALPADTLPPGCAADLLAMAQALASQ